MQGLKGPNGTQGVQWAVGLSFQGAYSSVVNYGAGDGVLYGGAGYVSLVAGNIGNAPDQSPGKGALFAGAGGRGPAGGPTGATRPQGPAVANYMGNYVSGTNYGLNDAVSYEGSTYISLVAGNVGHTPSL